MKKDIRRIRKPFTHQNTEDREVKLKDTETDKFTSNTRKAREIKWII